LSVGIAQLKSELNEEKARPSAASKKLEASVTEQAKLSTQLKESEKNLKDFQEQHAAKSKQLEKIASLSLKEEDVRTPPHRSPSSQAPPLVWA
jgi:septal ring factor EnvC (AmiA/AmiB activator)